MIAVRQANLRGGRRLAAIADELQPARAPFWVSQPRGATPAQGWWWTPAGARTPQFLGHNHVTAEVALMRLVDAQYAPRHA